MNEERSGVRLAVANGKLYAVGGDKTSEKDSIEIFDPEKDHWTFLGYLNDRSVVIDLLFSYDLEQELESYEY
ncbi:kelch repeat protein [Cooperia oncophora]